jgi:hypothetical protein
MAAQGNIAAFLEIRGIDLCQTAAAIPDKEMIGSALHTDIVRVVAKFNLPHRRVFRSQEQTQRPVTRIGDVKRAH